MPDTLVAYWDTPTNHDWTDETETGMTLFQKIAALGQATEAAAHEAELVLNGGDQSWIFIGPEYSFGQSRHLTVDEMNRVQWSCEGLSTRHKRMLLIPGTAPVKGPKVRSSGVQKAINKCVAYHDGAKVASFGKKNPVGEVAEGSGLTFEAGAGKGTFSIGDTSFGIQVCKDATIEGVLDSDVDVHIVVGQGVGIEAIRRKCGRYLMVGAYGTHGVWDCTGAPEKIDSFKTGSAMGVTIHYTRVAL